MLISKESVSTAELQQHLDRLARQSTLNRKEQVAEQLGDASRVMGYDFCLWWDGCYYCRCSQGSWEQITCFA
jgi:hypothetical protein